MASDGCQSPAFVGQAFSYLMHHPGFVKTENYGMANASGGAHGAGDPHGAAAGKGRRANTGVWDGPAPRGAGAAAVAAAAAAAAPAAGPATDPDSVLLPNGVRLPLVGFGTYKIEAEAEIASALELGYRHFDCAAMYGNEALVGRALAPTVAAGQRGELFVASKVWQTAHRPADARASVVQSLSDLGLEYLDLVYLHWPEAWLPGSDIKDPSTIRADESVDLVAAWRGLEALVDEGLVRGLGLSNCSLTQLEAVLAAAHHAPLVHQCELHPLLAQRKAVGVAARRGVVSVAHSPLGSHKTREALEHPVVAAVAAEAGKTPAQVLLKYNLQRGVAVIPKAASRARQEENLVGMFEWRLSNAQKAKLDALDAGKRFIDYPWKQWGAPEEGGAAKPSRSEALAAAVAAAGGGSA